MRSFSASCWLAGCFLVCLLACCLRRLLTTNKPLTGVLFSNVNPNTHVRTSSPDNSPNFHDDTGQGHMMLHPAVCRVPDPASIHGEPDQFAHRFRLGREQSRLSLQLGTSWTSGSTPANQRTLRSGHVAGPCWRPAGGPLLPSWETDTTLSSGRPQALFPL